MQKNKSINIKEDDLSGIELEKAVAKVQQKLDPSSIVTHNEFIIDRIGNRRQFDVVVRGTFAGRNVLAVIECKDHSRKKGPETIEAFAKKCENVKANVKVIVSRRGFTDQALNLAKNEGIGCLSPLPNGDKSAWFSVGSYVYAVIKTWSDLRIFMSPLPDPDFLKSFTTEDIKYEGKQVGNWFMRELIINHQHIMENKEYGITVKFDNPVDIQCGEKTLKIDKITGAAKRIIQWKRKWVAINGDAFYDWHDGVYTIPGGDVMTTDAFEADASTWPDCDGPPEDANENEQKGVQIELTMHRHQIWREENNVLVPELMEIDDSPKGLT